MAHFSLSSPDVAVRLDAVREMSRSLDGPTVTLLRQRLGMETNSSVRKEIATALALAALDGPDTKARLDAIATLRHSVSQDVRNRLALLIDKSPDGSFAESDRRCAQAAAAAVTNIDFWRNFYSGIQTLFFWTSLGSVLVLIAIGLAITFGVMGVINMAHGELMMLGAYTTYVVQTIMPGHIGISILVAIPAAFIVAGMTGVVLERTIIRFLYGRPLETLLATFGVSLILQQSVRSIFSALNRSVVTPDWMSGSLRLNDALAITYNRLYIVIFTLIVFALILLVLRRTRLGLDIRAVSQNRSMAKAMGIRTEWVDAMTFGLGSGVAGVAGVALSQLTNVGPDLGQSYIIDSFLVVVFGGVGNLWGSLIGGVSMGVVNNLLQPYAGAVLAKIFVLVALILFIQVRPRGLFPQKGRARRTSRQWLYSLGSKQTRRSRRQISPSTLSGAGRRRDRLQPTAARVVPVSPVGLHHHSHRQVPLLRDAGAFSRLDLGLLRYFQPWARSVFCTRRLRHGHVPDAADRFPRCLWQSHFAGLHGVSEL